MVNMVSVTRTAMRVLVGVKASTPLAPELRNLRLVGRTVLQWTLTPKRLTMVMTTLVVSTMTSDV